MSKPTKWVSDCLAAWQEHTKDSNVHQCRPGKWFIACELKPLIEQPDMQKLKNTIPSFDVFPVLRGKPYSSDDGVLINAFQLEKVDVGRARSDFWCVHPEGRSFLLQPYQDDHFRTEAKTTLCPKWFCAKLSQCVTQSKELFSKLADTDGAILEVYVKCDGLTGRKLWLSHSNDAFSAVTAQDDIIELNAAVSDTSTDVFAEAIYSMMKPLARTFQEPISLDQIAKWIAA